MLQQTTHPPLAAPMTNWTPALVQTLMTIAVMVGIGLAVVGQVRWRAAQEWEALADARQQRILQLEQEVGMLRTNATAQEGQIADVQRLNRSLQLKLEQLERSLGERSTG